MKGDLSIIKTYNYWYENNQIHEIRHLKYKEGYQKSVGKDVLFNDFRKTDYLGKRSKAKIKSWFVKDLKVK